jgi:hypothetical protein
MEMCNHEWPQFWTFGFTNICTVQYLSTVIHYRDSNSLSSLKPQVLATELQYTLYVSNTNINIWPHSAAGPSNRATVHPLFSQYQHQYLSSQCQLYCRICAQYLTLCFASTISSPFHISFMPRYRTNFWRHVLSNLFISLVPMLTPLYQYVNTFHSMCAVPNMAVFCSSLTSWFSGTLLTYFQKRIWNVSIRAYYYGNPLCFTLHMRCISTVRSLCFKIFGFF